MKNYVGVDVGKYFLDVFYQGKSFHYNNDAKGIVLLLKSLDNSDALVVFEATGGYEKLLRETLQNKKHPCHMAHPNKIRAFAKAKGQLAKTDRLDACLIADYAQATDAQ